MRVLPFVLATLPLPVLAGEFALSSNVSAVTLYPQGATVTRTVPYSIPEGQHDLILTDLPRDTPLASVRVVVDGARMGSVTARRDFIPPHSDAETTALRTARAEVERLEAKLRQAKGDVRAIRLEVEAAGARVAFLEKLGEGDGVAELGAADLRDLLTLIGDETLKALQVAHEADRRASEAELALQDLTNELERAKQAMSALVPEKADRAMLAIAVSSTDATQGVVKVTYNTSQATWRPVYDVRLARRSGTLRLDRGAYVTQSTGENWKNASLTLSTVRPSEQTSPSDIWPWLRRVHEANLRAQREPESLEMLADSAGVRLATKSASVDQAEASFDGLAVTYSYPGTVSVASGADRVRLALGSVETQVELVAQAVPLSDQTAFLMAEFTNDMGEPILPSGEASFYLDERFVGLRPMQLITAGDEANLSFGPIDGLHLKRTVVDRNEGDRGVITKSNEISETVRIEVENLTGESWSLRLLDRVPYSEQEDLKITWSASQKPDDDRVDDKRGVLAWSFNLAAGASKDLTLSHKVQWPQGLFLQ